MLREPEDDGCGQREGRGEPRSPHLDHHLDDPKRGMYSMRTDEMDILNIVKDKKAKGV